MSCNFLCLKFPELGNYCLYCSICIIFVQFKISDYKQLQARCETWGQFQLVHHTWVPRKQNKNAKRNVRTSVAVTLNWQTKINQTLQCNRKQQWWKRVEILIYDQTALQSIKRGPLVETQENVHLKNTFQKKLAGLILLQDKYDNNRQPLRSDICDVSWEEGQEELFPDNFCTVWSEGSHPHPQCQMLASEKLKRIHINVTEADSWVKVQMFMCAHLFIGTGFRWFQYTRLCASAAGQEFPLVWKSSSWRQCFSQWALPLIQLSLPWLTTSCLSKNMDSERSKRGG